MRRTSPVDATFVVRVSLDRRGRLTGTVERVKTGEKARFDGPEGLGWIISRMAARGLNEVTDQSPTP